MPRTRPPSPVRVGMRADELRKMRGRSKFDLVAAPVWVEYGRVVRWFYADCMVTLRKDELENYPGLFGPYRVTEVLEEVGDGTED